MFTVRLAFSLWLAVAVLVVIRAPAVAHGAGQCSAQGAPLVTEPEVKGELHAGDSLFWDGECVEQVRGNLSCAFHRQPTSPYGQPGCWVYRFRVLDAGAMLRVAVDTATRGDFYVLALSGPNGEAISDGNAPFAPGVGTPQQYAREVRVPEAAAGLWEVRITANDVDDWAFRVRAALPRAPHKEPAVVAPNLVPLLPYEFGFVAPASPRAGSEHDRENPPGTPGISCHSDESPEQHCLRFSTGVGNAGAGPLLIAFDGDRAQQHVYLSDDTPGDYGDNEREGRYRLVEAGTAQWHESHQHRHFNDMINFQLLTVSAGSSPHGRPQLTPVDEGSKHGVCTADQAIADWRQLDQDPAYTLYFQVGLARDCQTGLSLDKGWGDYYRWQRPGQYVPYDRVMDPDGTMRAGLYVVRINIDENDRIVETSEEDNVGYAYIRVVDGPPPGGDQVVICERGIGESPWDPHRRVAAEPFWWNLLDSSQAAHPDECRPPGLLR